MRFRDYAADSRVRLHAPHINNRDLPPYNAGPLSVQLNLKVEADYFPAPVARAADHGMADTLLDGNVHMANH
ncbi:hypothetical protein D3C71_2163230 [compost metagenome]